MHWLLHTGKDACAMFSISPSFVKRSFFSRQSLYHVWDGLDSVSLKPFVCQWQSQLGTSQVVVQSSPMCQVFNPYPISVLFFCSVSPWFASETLVAPAILLF